jgi:hypothetical protein
MNEELHSRLGRLEGKFEVHADNTKERFDRLEDDTKERFDRLDGKVDQLLARPSTLAQAGGFVAEHWKVLLVIAFTLTGAGWAAPLLAALK